MNNSFQYRSRVVSAFVVGAAALSSTPFDALGEFGGFDAEVAAQTVYPAPGGFANDGAVPFGDATAFGGAPVFDNTATFPTSPFPSGNDFNNFNGSTVGSIDFAAPNVLGSTGSGVGVAGVPNLVPLPDGAWSGDINSIPILEVPQPNRPRALPPLKVPQTDAEFNKRVDALLARFSKPPLSIQNSTPGRLIRYSQIGGADQTFLAVDPTATLREQAIGGANGSNDGNGANGGAPELKPTYALGVLCWNLPCEGRKLLREVDGYPVPTVGYGFQTTRGEFLATLAVANIDRNYELRIDEQKFSVQSLVEWEKRSCSKDVDLSLVAVGLAHYAQDPDETWTNAFGEEWSLVKILDLETKRPIDWASSESTDKLLALTYLLARLKRGRNADSPLIRRTEAFLVALKSRVWELFGDQALGETLFFDAETRVETPYMKLFVDGRILLWVALTASSEELRADKTRRAFAELCALVDQLFNSVDNLDRLSPTDEDSFCVALRALATYRKRAASR